MRNTLTLLSRLSFAACLLVACVPETPQVPATAYLPTRARLLTNHELALAAKDLLGVPVDVAGKLPPEVRQSGYTRNAAAPLAAETALRWRHIVESTVPAALAAHLPPLLACAPASLSSCRAQAVIDLGEHAFRRPLSAAEASKLLQVFDAGLKSGGVRAGLELVLETLLQAPSFLYAVELGEASELTSGRLVQLSPYEIATELSFTFSGAPPDTALREAARNGSLLTAAARRGHAQRLLAASDSRYLFRSFVLEWLEVDRLAEVTKDATTFPEFDALKAELVDETSSFTDQVLMQGGPTLSALLTGRFTSASPRVARYYGLSAFGPRVSLLGSARLGVLQQGSVLAAHAHPEASSPVKRGDFVLRRLLCKTLPRPSELGIEVVMPKADGVTTARAQLAAHTASPLCASCHSEIDPIGLTFENFDAGGRERREEVTRAVDTHGALAQETSSGETTERPLQNSQELSQLLAREPVAKDCFARQAFRYFSGTSEANSEAQFLKIVGQLPPERRENLLEMLVAYAGSDLFVRRRLE